MSVIPLSQLADMVSAESGTPSAETQIFIDEYFRKAENLLVGGQDVEIAGVGTLHFDAAAEGKVILMPDSTLAEEVNEPFAAFEPVQIPAAPTVPVIEEAAEPEDDEEVWTEKAETVVPTPAACAASIPEEPTEDEDEPMPLPPPMSTFIPPVVPPPCKPGDAEDRAPEPQPKKRSRAFVWLISAIAFAVGLILGFIGGKTCHTNVYIGGTFNETSITDTAAAEPKPKIEAPDTSAVVAAPTSVEAQVDSLSRSPRYDTITGTTFLTSLARKYYGGKWYYWVYIYDANKLDHPTRIKPGTRVIVPYEDELPLTGNHQTDSLAASKRAREIEAK